MKNAFVILSIFFTLSNFSTLSAECKFISPKVDLPASYEENLEILEYSTEALSHTSEDMILTKDLTEFQKHDRRKVKDNKSPSFLDAVGKIIITRKDGKKNICSGVLVSSEAGQASRVIQSSAHCFANLETQQKFEIKSITWETTLKSGKMIKKDLKIEELNMRQDLSVLSLSDKIPFDEVKPLIVLRDLLTQADTYISFSKQAVMAGFSADSYKGQNGNVLTYDDSITIEKLFNVQDGNASFKSVTFQGASGGALIADIDLSQVGVNNPHNQKVLAGTIRGSIQSRFTLQFEDENNKKGTTITQAVDNTKFSSDLYGKLNKK